jgi:Trypsin-like peptidase domain
MKKDSWKKSITLIRSSNSPCTTFGTGFSVYCEGQATYITTCAHVVDDILSEIRDKGGSITAVDAKATLVTSGFQDGKGIDLAVLRVEGLLDHPPLRRTSEEEDKSFETEGFQRSDQDFIRRSLKGWFGGQIEIGRGAQANFARAWDLKIQGDYHLEEGYSGSPVVDENGYIVAVVNTRAREGIIGTAISIETLEKFWLDMPKGIFADVEEQPPISDKSTTPHDYIEAIRKAMQEDDVKSVFYAQGDIRPIQFKKAREATKMAQDIIQKMSNFLNQDRNLRKLTGIALDREKIFIKISLLTEQLEELNYSIDNSNINQRRKKFEEFFLALRNIENILP